MNELSEAALDYVHRGFPVFPVKPGGKRPLGRLVPNGFKDATLDEQRTRCWWGEEPSANVGLVTGIPFDVLDVDGPEGIEALNAAMSCHGEVSDKRPMNGVDGPTVITGGGGYHVYLAVTGYGNRVGFLPHVDWRGRGGYVVAPPSVHPNGRRYEWLSGRGLSREIAPAPGWLLELLWGRPTSLNNTGQLTRRAGETTPYARRALEGEVGRVFMAPVGARNDTLNKAAFSVGQLIAGRAIEDAVAAVQALLDAGQAVGLGREEVIATVRSGVGAGSLQPRSAPRRLAS
jgi:hypothetical protein